MKIYQKYAHTFSEYSKWLNHNSPEGCVKEMKGQHHGKVLLKFSEKLLSSEKISNDSQLQKLAKVCVSTLKQVSFSKELKVRARKVEAQFSNVHQPKSTPQNKVVHSAIEKGIKQSFDRIEHLLNKEKVDLGKLREELEKLQKQTREYKKSAKNGSSALHRLKKIEAAILEYRDDVSGCEVCRKFYAAAAQYVHDLEKKKDLGVWKKDLVQVNECISQFLHLDAVKNGEYDDARVNFEKVQKTTKEAIAFLDEAMTDTEMKEKLFNEREQFIALFPHALLEQLKDQVSALQNDLVTGLRKNLLSL
jgi:hypothetical protein